MLDSVNNNRNIPDLVHIETDDMPYAVNLKMLIQRMTSFHQKDRLDIQKVIMQLDVCQLQPSKSKYFVYQVLRSMLIYHHYNVNEPYQLPFVLRPIFIQIYFFIKHAGIRFI